MSKLELTILDALSGTKKEIEEGRKRQISRWLPVRSILKVIALMK